MVDGQKKRANRAEQGQEGRKDHALSVWVSSEYHSWCNSLNAYISIFKLGRGGYLIGTCYPGHDFGSIAPTILKQIKEECKQNNDALDTLPQSIVSVEYRRTELAPTPGALIDALSVYRHLVDDLHFKPSNISLSGDSAGGHLVNSLIRYLVEGGEETPGKIVLISVSDLLSRASLNLIDMLLPYYSPGAIKPGQQLSRAIRHSNECYHMTF
jgi:hypothetical protein